MWISPGNRYNKYLGRNLELFRLAKSYYKLQFTSSNSFKMRTVFNYRCIFVAMLRMITRSPEVPGCLKLNFCDPWKENEIIVHLFSIQASFKIISFTVQVY